MFSLRDAGGTYFMHAFPFSFFFALVAFLTCPLLSLSLPLSISLSLSVAASFPPTRYNDDDPLSFFPHKKPPSCFAFASRWCHNTLQAFFSTH